MDEFCRQQGISKVDFIKADVEGFEERLIAGAASTLRRWTPLILIEFDPPKLIRAGSAVDRLAAQFHALNYSLWVAERERLVPLTTLPRGLDYINVFCVPESRRSAVMSA